MENKSKLKKPTLTVSKAKKLKMLHYLKGILKTRNCFMCNEIGFEFGEYNTVRMKDFLPELYAERPRTDNEIGITPACWGTDLSSCELNEIKNKRAKISWAHRIQAVDKAITTVKKLSK